MTLKEADLRRLMDDIGMGRVIDEYAMTLAQAIYTLGAKRMQERAAGECDPSYTVLDVKRYILKLEAEK